MMGLSISSKFYWGSYISLAKSALEKIGISGICSMKFLSSEVAFIIPPSDFGCNVVWTYFWASASWVC